jgi:hypothetical protein
VKLPRPEIDVIPSQRQQLTAAKTTAPITPATLRQRGAHLTRTSVVIRQQIRPHVRQQMCDRSRSLPIT